MEKQSKESSPRRFLTDMMAHYRRSSRKKNIPFDLDLDFLSNLWQHQNGRCAITGVEMTHIRQDLCGVRIDAIDTDKGFIKGNTQLICDGIKRMKRDMNNKDVIGFVQEIKSVVVI
jgi:hypothetical protein